MGLTAGENTGLESFHHQRWILLQPCVMEKEMRASKEKTD